MSKTHVAAQISECVSAIRSTFLRCFWPVPGSLPGSVFCAALGSIFALGPPQEPTKLLYENRSSNKSNKNKFRLWDNQKKLRLPASSQIWKTTTTKTSKHKLPPKKSYKTKSKTQTVLERQHFLNNMQSVLVIDEFYIFRYALLIQTSAIRTYFLLQSWASSGNYLWPSFWTGLGNLFSEGAPEEVTEYPYNLYKSKTLGHFPPGKKKEKKHQHKQPKLSISNPNSKIRKT